MPSLVLDRVIWLQIDLVHNWRALLDSRFLLKEQMAVMLRQAFLHIFVLHASDTIPALRGSTQFFVHWSLPVALLYCTLHGAIMEGYLQA